MGAARRARHGLHWVHGKLATMLPARMSGGRWRLLRCASVVPGQAGTDPSHGT